MTISTTIPSKKTTRAMYMQSAASHVQRIGGYVLLCCVLFGCGLSQREREKTVAEEQELSTQDDTYRGIEKNAKVRLEILHETTKTPLLADELVVFGYPTGLKKKKYMVDDKPVPFSCWFVPFACYSEKGPSPTTRGRAIASVGRLTEASGGEFEFTGVDPFRFSKNFNEVTISRYWEGKIAAKGYCATDHQRVIDQISASAEGRLTTEMNPVVLRAIEDDVVKRIRYYTLLSAELGVTRNLHRADNLSHVYETVLGWAAPKGRDPFESAIYVSLLRGVAAHDWPQSNGDWDNRKNLEIASKRIAEHLDAARDIYYANDDWRIVSSDVQIHWGKPKSAMREMCIVPPTASRIPLDSSAIGQYFPLLSNRNYRENLRDWHGFGGRAQLAEELRLKPYSFCLIPKASSSRYSTLSSASDGQPMAWINGELVPIKQADIAAKYAGAANIVLPSQGSMDRSSGVPTIGARAYSFSCRHVDAKKCNLNGLDGLGDTPVMSLLRRGASSDAQHSFVASAAAYGAYRLRSEVEQYAERKKILDELVTHGANTALVNPALDVNAIELAIDPFIAHGLYSNNTYGDDVHWSTQNEIVSLLLNSLKAFPGATLRADYRAQIAEAYRSKKLTTHEGNQTAWRLSKELTDQLLALPTRSVPAVCGENFMYSHWFHRPGRNDRVTPLKLN